MKPRRPRADDDVISSAATTMRERLLADRPIARGVAEAGAARQGMSKWPAAATRRVRGLLDRPGTRARVRSRPADTREPDRGPASRALGIKNYTPVRAPQQPNASLRSPIGRLPEPLSSTRCDRRLLLVLGPRGSAGTPPRKCILVMAADLRSSNTLHPSRSVLHPLKGRSPPPWTNYRLHGRRKRECRIRPLVRP